MYAISVIQDIRIQQQLQKTVMTVMKKMNGLKIMVIVYTVIMQIISLLKVIVTVAKMESIIKQQNNVTAIKTLADLMTVDVTHVVMTINL